MQTFLDIDPDSHFSVHNLPYGVFRPKRGGPARIGVAVGEYVLDLAVLDEAALLAPSFASGKKIFHRDTLNPFMALGRTAWREVRGRLQDLLSGDDPALRDHGALREAAFHRQCDVEMLLPAEIGDYTDFYASKYHASNVGEIFRGKENALNPNWMHLPVGYHGRAGSIVVSGTPVRRPSGQFLDPRLNSVQFGPTRQLDFELEVGWLIGPGNRQGEPVPIDEAEDRIFGLVLVNDWSARDIQAWEYRPLGPFLSKNFATSISPWVVPFEALEPFRVGGEPMDVLPYLRPAGPDHFDIRLEVHIRGRNMVRPQRVCRTNFRYLHWSMAQQIAHHTVNGCNLRTGDLMASGTISGPEASSRGCLLELTWGGSEPLRLDNGETRVWLEDGDEVIMTGWCQGDGFRVGFGELRGCILPALKG